MPAYGLAESGTREQFRPPPFISRPLVRNRKWPIPLDLRRYTATGAAGSYPSPWSVAELVELFTNNAANVAYNAELGTAAAEKVVSPQRPRPQNSDKFPTESRSFDVNEDGRPAGGPLGPTGQLSIVGFVAMLAECCPMVPGRSHPAPARHLSP
jgi:hypothetical protein